MIALGSDHGGYNLKQYIKDYLISNGTEVYDYGTYSTESSDYPVYAKKVADAVVSGECERGLLFCGTGVGVSIAANKVRGIRAACCSDTFSAKYARLHNDANILCMGERVVGYGLAVELINTFLNTGFEGGRHQRRIGLITDFDNDR